MSEDKVISLRITPKRDGFTATVIGPRPANLGPRPVLVQRTEPTEYLAACAALHALFTREGPLSDLDQARAVAAARVEAAADGDSNDEHIAALNDYVAVLEAMTG